VLARGDLKLAATIKATKQLPLQHVQQAATPYAFAASSAASRGKSSSQQRQSAGMGASTTARAISVEDVTEQLSAELLHPSDMMSFQWLVRLLARSCSPSPDAEPFDPALCTAFEQWVLELRQQGSLLQPSARLAGG
jgi:hypothetical protein